VSHRTATIEDVSDDDEHAADAEFDGLVTDESGHVSGDDQDDDMSDAADGEDKKEATAAGALGGRPQLPFQDAGPRTQRRRWRDHPVIVGTSKLLDFFRRKSPRIQDNALSNSAQPRAAPQQQQQRQQQGAPCLCKAWWGTSASDPHGQARSPVNAQGCRHTRGRGGVGIAGSGAWAETGLFLAAAAVGTKELCHQAVLRLQGAWRDLPTQHHLERPLAASH